MLTDFCQNIEKIEQELKTSALLLANIYGRNIKIELNCFVSTDNKKNKVVKINTTNFN